MSPEEIAASALAGMDKKTPAATAATDNKDSRDNKHQQQQQPQKKRRGPKPKIKFPKEPRVIQTIPRRKEYVNHTYRDFSEMLPEVDYEKCTKIEDMSFSEKVHDMLTKQEYAKLISWRPHGRAFRVDFPLLFEKKVCPVYFGHKRYSSFLRQLNNHGFKHLTKGDDRNSYYHECFLREMVHLSKYMPPAKDARRQIPDPENEPNFDAISRMYPLPDIEGRQGVTNAVEQESQVGKVPANPGVLANPGAPPNEGLPPDFYAVYAASAAERSSKSPGPNAAVPPAATRSPVVAASLGQKNVMDRSAALAEIKSLRARLASDLDPSTEAPPAKRQAFPTTMGVLGQSTTPVSSLNRMPQFFPTRGTSQAESVLQQNAILSAIRNQQSERRETHSIQELQMEQRIKELRAQQNLEQLQAQQRLQELQAQRTLQDLRARHAVNELQKQQAIQEMEETNMTSQLLQQQQREQFLRDQLSLQGRQQLQPQQQSQPQRQSNLMRFSSV